MTAPPPRRPWWTRKRTWAVIAAWLLLLPLYVVGDGLNQYAIGRGWGHPGPVRRFLYAPPKWIAVRTGHRMTLLDWRQWWFDLAQRHKAEAEAASD